MKRLGGVDAMLLYSETTRVHMHTLKVGVLDVSRIRGGYTFETFRQTACPRLLGLPPLRYQLVEIPMRFHHPMWRENAAIDPDYHIQRVQVPAPGGRRELDDVIGEIASVPLERERPLWQMFVAEGLAQDRVAVIWKIHHALADGVASANLIAKALQSFDELAVEGLTAQPDRMPSRRALLLVALADHLRQLAAMPILAADTIAGIVRVLRGTRKRRRDPRMRRPLTPPPSFFNHLVAPGRRFATAPLALADVKQTAKALNITINDLVLVICAGALRELMMRHGDSVETPLIAGVPVSFNKSADRLSGNEIGYMTPPLAVHISDPSERIQLTAQANADAKENFNLRGPTLMASWLSYLPPAVAPAMFRWQSERWTSGLAMNCTISNVPGPREQSGFDGAIISEIYSVGPLAAGSALNVTVWSYADQLAISVLTDDETVPDAHDVTAAMTHEFRLIRRVAGLPTVLTPLSGVLPSEELGHTATNRPSETPDAQRL